MHSVLTWGGGFTSKISQIIINGLLIRFVDFSSVCSIELDLNSKCSYSPHVLNRINCNLINN